MRRLALKSADFRSLAGPPNFFSLLARCRIPTKSLNFNFELAAYHELYGSFSNGEIASDAECTSVIPEELCSGLRSKSSDVVTQSFAFVIGSEGIC